MKRILALLIALLLSGCRAAPDEAIAALFEYRDMRFRHYRLDVQGADPTAEQLALIRKFNAGILPASQCHHEKDSDRTSDGRYIQMLRIVKTSRSLFGTVRIDVVNDSGFLLGSGGSTFTVERLSGVWVVTGYEMEWIS